MDIGSGGRKGRKRKGKRDTRDLEQNMFWKRLGDRTSLAKGIYIYFDQFSQLSRSCRS